MVIWGFGEVEHIYKLDYGRYYIYKLDYGRYYIYKLDYGRYYKSSWIMAIVK